MLFHPLVLQGIAALKALLLLTTGPAATQDQNVLGRRTVGAIIFTMALASTSSMVIYNPPGDPPLYELMVPPPMDLIVWEPISKMCFDYSPKMAVENDAGGLPDSEASPPLAATPVPATKSHSAQTPVRSKRVASPFEYWRVPKIDWSTPGVPTVKARKAQKTTPRGVHIDLFFVDFYFSPEHGVTFPKGLFDMDPWLRPPSEPNDDTPRWWQYEAPELRCERLCLRKGRYPDIGAFKLGCVLALRTYVLFETLRVIGSWLLPIPRYLRRAWRAYKRSKRPLRIRPGDACGDAMMRQLPPPVPVWFVDITTALGNMVHPKRPRGAPGRYWWLMLGQLPLSSTACAVNDEEFDPLPSASCLIIFYSPRFVWLQ
ncbi:hypothetical protein FOMPIDRAFT_82306 [Fomitopsis schrenkii]|uniref:Uncharacterized protein n=1 Tax=Fomitopsis schrenkii TaxID=2126942 RepID=S8DUJ8_FOMSC|nr:hypothetical protein FOMPIDRAFT_82306 [Fomitopsis schrenkii]